MIPQSTMLSQHQHQNCTSTPHLPQGPIPEIHLQELALQCIHNITRPLHSSNVTRCGTTHCVAVELPSEVKHSCQVPAQHSTAQHTSSIFKPGSWIIAHSSYDADVGHCRWGVLHAPSTIKGGEQWDGVSG
jgi:hypothetical protein